MTDRVAEPLHPVARELAEAHGGLMSYPPVERWEDWEEYDPVAWPQKVKRRYSLIPTICFNCEAGCGLLAYVDRETLAIQKFEGNPVHPQRVFHAWGIDGHNSHTNVCSASARAGYAFWHGMDRPSPDHANARFILLLSSHLETGHYFNPHAQRIMEAKARGARIAVLDTRLSNTASMADWWLAPWPGSESAVLLAMAHILVREKLYDREFVRRWVNWEE